MASGPVRRTALRIGLVAVSASLSLLVAEICGNVYYSVTRGGLFYSRVAESAPASDAWPQASARLAPFFGFSNPAGVSIGDMVIANQGPGALGQLFSDRVPAWFESNSNNYGFFAGEDYPTEPPEALSIGIFGGSVAERLAIQGGARLASRVGAGSSPARILNFAQAGYKQPQQLLVLAYYLSLGQTLDVVVNVDGVNDAAMGLLNEREGFAFSMPWIPRMRSLGLQASAHFDPRTELYLARLAIAKAEVRRWRQRCRTAWLAASYLVADLWLGHAQRRLDALVDDPPASASGPGHELIRLVPSRGGGDVGRRISRHWAGSSAMMAALAEGAGARYLHLLQPNQYAGARVFSPAEKRRALNPRSPFRDPVRELYPLLREEGGRLAASGVHFVDATALFDDVPEPIYVDDCCHYTQLGNDILADLVASEIRAFRLDRPGARGRDGRLR